LRISTGTFGTSLSSRTRISLIHALPPNNELKLTKPSILELRSLTPVFGGR
jgi:hypothetical protein